MSANLRAIIGGLGWVGFVATRGADPAGWAQTMVAFAALVLVPLALELFVEADEAGFPAGALQWARAGQLPASLLVGAACWLPAGAPAAILTLPWLALAGLLAVAGIQRLRRERFRRSFEGMCADVALVFFALGALWTGADRAGVVPEKFDAATVAATAVHFHYAGLLLPLIAGLVQRELFVWRMAARAAVGVVLGVPALAFGVTANRLGWGTSLESAAGCGLALAGMIVGILQVRIALDVRGAALTRALLVLSGAALFVGQALGAAQALRGSLALGLAAPQVQQIHGSLLAFGFGLAGVVGWRRMATRAEGGATA
jgi:hypothetical protein